MKKIAIICTEDKPVPAVEGGAVETIVENIILLNKKKKLANIDIYSTANETIDVEEDENTRYYFYKGKSSKIEKLRNRVVLKMGFKNMYRCRFLNQVIKQLKDSDYDYIIVQNRPQFILKLKKHLKNSSKIILHLHNKHFFTNSFSSSLNEQIYDGFDGILGVSDFIREQVFLHAPRMCANKLKTLQNMVDTEKFKPMSVEKIAVYEKLANKNVVSFHGRLIPEKGVLELIIAYKIAAKSISNLALLIIGKLNNTSYCERLKEEMNKDIIFVDGISHSEIEKYLSIADLSVAPSLCDEASGLAHLESLAMGKPLITTTGGGPEEFIEHRKTGFLVDVTPNFEESLAAQIIDCFEDRELMLKIGDNAREFVVENRSLDQYLENLVFTLNLFGRRS